MSTVLHILPHRGGGGETVVDLIGRIEHFEHRRHHLADARTPLRAAPSLALGLARASREATGADLLHVVGDVAAILCTPLYGGRPAVWSTQGLHLLRRSEGPAGAPVRAALRAAIGRSAATICSSRSELAELAELIGPGRRDRLVEIPNGIPLPAVPTADERAQARHDLGLGEDAVAALVLGELEERKRPMDAVAATVAARRAGHRELVLLVAGSGPLAEQLGTSGGDAVRMLGFRRDPERLLAAADVFLMPSAREGLSLALLEAMAHALPVVASVGPGNPEGLGDTGVLHAVGDRDALARALGELAVSPQRRRELGAAARARAESHFSVERFDADVAAAFERALAG